MKSLQVKNENEFSAVGIYQGHSIKNSYDVELKLLFTAEHSEEALQFIAGITNYIKVICNKSGNKLKLGTWGVYRFTIDKNMQVKISLKSTTENANIEALNALVVDTGSDDTEMVFKVRVETN